ncbi:MAG: hypothetical protein JNM69_06795 [Archangium sp.]|nr:hypothetical protein [Archangium sp.]
MSSTEYGRAVSLQAMTSVLSELTSEAVDATWRTPVAIRRVLGRVVEEAPRHIVLLPDSRADEAFDLAADGVDFVDGDVAELRFLRDEVGGVPVIFAPEELRMMATRSGPLLHMRLGSQPPIGRSQGGLLEELFAEVRDEQSESAGPHAYRLLGGNIIIVPQGFMVGGRLMGDLPSGTWSRMLRLSADALRAQLG